jgi:hypothetical protein
LIGVFVYGVGIIVIVVIEVVIKTEHSAVLANFFGIIGIKSIYNNQIGFQILLNIFF